jgi:hypothetical protein
MIRGAAVALPEPNPYLAMQRAQAVAGLAAALRGVNAAAVRYAEVWGAWPRYNESIARVLTTPLDSLELDQQLDIATLQVVPGHD